eukprot:1942122-Prymnesium_polylepis.1
MLLPPHDACHCCVPSGGSLDVVTRSAARWQAPSLSRSAALTLASGALTASSQRGCHLNPAQSRSW